MKNKIPKQNPNPLINNKKEVEKIVAKYDDVMGFFEKKLSLLQKLWIKNNAEKSINDGQNNNIVNDIVKDKWSHPTTKNNAKSTKN